MCSKQHNLDPFIICSDPSCFLLDEAEIWVYTILGTVLSMVKQTKKQMQEIILLVYKIPKLLLSLGVISAHRKELTNGDCANWIQIRREAKS